MRLSNLLPVGTLFLCGGWVPTGVTAQREVPVIEENEGFEVDLEPFTVSKEVEDQLDITETAAGGVVSYNATNIERYLGTAMRESLPNLFGVLLYYQTKAGYYTGMAIFRGPPYRTPREVFNAQSTALESFQGSFVDVHDGDGVATAMDMDEQEQNLHKVEEHPQLYAVEKPEDDVGTEGGDFVHANGNKDSSQQQQQLIDSRGGSIVLAVALTFAMTIIFMLLVGFHFHKHYRCIPRKRQAQSNLESILSRYNGKDKSSDNGSQNGDDIERGSSSDEDEELEVDLYQDEPDKKSPIKRKTSHHRRVKSTLPGFNNGRRNHGSNSLFPVDVDGSAHRRWNSFGVTSPQEAPASGGSHGGNKRPSMVDLLNSLDDEDFDSGDFM